MAGVMMGWGGVEERGWRKGPWTPEEDKLLSEHVNLHGEGRWSSVARCTGIYSIHSSLLLTSWLVNPSAIGKSLFSVTLEGIENLNPESSLLSLHESATPKSYEVLALGVFMLFNT